MLVIAGCAACPATEIRGGFTFLQEDTREEAIPEGVVGGSTERIRRDVERVADLSYHGFAGQKHKRRGIALYVHDEDLRLLHNSAEARDEIAVEILLRALKSSGTTGSWAEDGTPGMPGVTALVP
ncbi:hypothetical protein [Streptomyces sp. NPDC059649]|uniref:hypothetical protein n=1 Tax=Streptomyces sp. NPDC059649 TaxID=3346895 RepID=UPI0036A233F0